MRVYRYVVVRHGSNAANQPMTPTSVVGYAEFPHPLKAHERTEAGLDFTAKHWHVSVYYNQWLEFVPWSRATVRQRQLAQEEEEDYMQAEPS